MSGIKQRGGGKNGACHTSAAAVLVLGRRVRFVLRCDTPGGSVLVVVPARQVGQRPTTPHDTYVVATAFRARALRQRSPRNDNRARETKRE